MSAFVLDASIAISWCFEEIQTPYAVAILKLISEGAEANVPSIWPLEVTNALVKAFRRQHITREELFEYSQRLASLQIAVDQEARAFTEVLILAERYQLTTYDAAYLELARRRNLPIATGDGNILQAAAGIRVPIMQV
ncbi:MAG TPA: type II toxin-antitoxin system VapC family toxin [Bryobacteraceae bacterium]|nr:type II toxin-antitoxin system VapC family toxin [Bryobacteraceae bacterium]